ncbi:hypothetical protein ACTXT7_011674 [Hymenolepis weldensis]
MQSISRHLGFIYGENDHHSNLEKLWLVTEMPRLTNVTTVRFFLSFISYYNKFLPTLHDVRTPPDGSMRKDTKENYSQIKKESLAIRFAVQKFYKCWSTTLLGYNFDIEYPNTAEFGLNDCNQKCPDEETAIIIVTDNAPNSLPLTFNISGEFIISLPHRPQLKIQAELFVDTLKRALQKSRGEGKTKEVLCAFHLK